MDFMHILGQKEAIWNTIFSILSDGGAPKRRGARENFPPSPPLDGPAVSFSILRVSVGLLRLLWVLEATNGVRSLNKYSTTKVPTSKTKHSIKQYLVNMEYSSHEHCSYHSARNARFCPPLSVAGLVYSRGLVELVLLRICWQIIRLQVPCELADGDRQ